MAINPSQFTATSIVDNFDVAVEFLAQRPSTNQYQTTPDTPNKLVAYYDSVTDYVELYIVDKSGYRYLRVG
jgi:uncharacterized FlgJ-related protein